LYFHIWGTYEKYFFLWDTKNNGRPYRYFEGVEVFGAFFSGGIFFIIGVL
jgi:hypothetical protein